MGRLRRHNNPDSIYHLIPRFVGGEWFITSDVERSLYLSLLEQELPKSDWKCLAYALMSSHIHLALVAGRKSLASWLRHVHGPFAESINATHNRIGAVFVKGPRDYVVDPDDPEDLVKTIAYIHNNPVRAGVVRRASESSWTSHCAYLGTSPTPSWLFVDEGLARMNVTDRGEFDRLVYERSGDRDIYPKRRRGRPKQNRRHDVHVLEMESAPEMGSDPFF